MPIAIAGGVDMLPLFSDAVFGSGLFGGSAAVSTLSRSGCGSVVTLALSSGTSTDLPARLEETSAFAGGAVSI
jgi:hypothetical protein